MKSSRVIGGGPAGLSAAIGLALAGCHVTLYEQRPRWQGRVCGAFLNPEAVGHLEWLGVYEAVKAVAVDVTFAKLTLGTRHMITPINQQGRAGWGVPREPLEKILLDRAVALGVEVRLGERYQASSVEDPTHLLVSAAGRFARDRQKKSSGWFGWNATFRNVQQRPGEMALHFYPHGYAGLLTFSDGTTNVCGLFHRQGAAPLNWEEVFAQARRESRPLFEQTVHAERVSESRGVGPLPFSLGLHKSEDGSLLVGDAAAVGDPFMGEGIGRALGAGPMIHAAWQVSLKGAALLSSYERMWRETYAPRFRLGRAARMIMERPRLFSLAAPVLIGNKWLVRRVTPHFHRGFLVKAQA